MGNEQVGLSKHGPSTSGDVGAGAPPRPIVNRTRGHKHGPITRLASPGTEGVRLKPFVFLDLFEAEPSLSSQGIGMHPHSGIATLTFLMEGSVLYEDTTGKSGVLPAGGVEWMRAGGGVWHSGAPVGTSKLKGFQLWIALPPSEECADPESIYLSPQQVPSTGPARVLLGRYWNSASPIRAPAEITYLAVTLKKGERWSFVPPFGHSVAWIAVSEGRVDAGQVIDAGEMVEFEESSESIGFVANQDSFFVLGSAVKHPYDLVMGHYSVHTSAASLIQGEAGIRAVAERLHATGDRSILV